MLELIQTKKENSFRKLFILQYTVVRFRSPNNKRTRNRV